MNSLTGLEGRERHEKKQWLRAVLSTKRAWLALDAALYSQMYTQYSQAHTLQQP